VSSSSLECFALLTILQLQAISVSATYIIVQMYKYIFTFMETEQCVDEDICEIGTNFVLFLSQTRLSGILTVSELKFSILDYLYSKVYHRASLSS
jgi:hypothetical protein